jgi:hypothetical protein
MTIRLGHRQADLANRDRISAVVATDNGAFKVGRPSCIGPGASYEQVGDRTALDGSMYFCPGSE